MTEIFPFIELTDEFEEEASDELPMAKEYAWDFETQEFKLKDGKMYFVEGNEAIKIWLWKLLKTPRYRYLIYSWDYGNELHELLGQAYTQNYINAEAKGFIEESIAYNLSDYVTEILNIETNFNGGRLTTDITVETPYGRLNIDAEID